MSNVTPDEPRATVSQLEPGTRVVVPWAGIVRTGTVIGNDDPRVVAYCDRYRRGGQPNQGEVFVELDWDQPTSAPKSAYPFWAHEVQAFEVRS